MVKEKQKTRNTLIYTVTVSLSLFVFEKVELYQYTQNDALAAVFGEEGLGHNAIAAGFQGQRQWMDHWPNCDYPEAILNSSFDYTGKKEPMTFATENKCFMLNLIIFP